MAGHVFVSYSRADQDYVDRLGTFLEDQGLQIWIDRRRIRVGAKWVRQIQKQVDNCAAMLVVMTPAAGESTWVQNEIHRAIEKGKEIFPLLLDGENFFALGFTQFEDVRTQPLNLPSDDFVRELWRTTQTNPCAAIKRPATTAADARPAAPRVTEPAPTSAERQPEPQASSVLAQATASRVAVRTRKPREAGPAAPSAAPVLTQREYVRLARALNSSRDPLLAVLARALALLAAAVAATLVGAIALPPTWWMLALGILGTVATGIPLFDNIYVRAIFPLCSAISLGTVLGVGIRMEGTDGYVITAAAAALATAVWRRQRSWRSDLYVRSKVVALRCGGH